MSFSESTQYQHWRFSPSQLEELRRNANKIANARFGREIVSYQEEQQVQYFIEKKIQESCASRNFPDKLGATAITFFKRVYLAKSLLDIPPKECAVCCICLASKSEEHNIPFEELIPMFQISSSTDVLTYELVILHILKFHLKIYHPYRSLYGFIADMQAKQLATSQQLEEVWQSGLKFIHKSLITDLQYLYSPSQIALGAIVATKTSLLDVPKYLNSCFPQETPALADVLGNIATLAELISMDQPTIDTKEIENILAKIYNYTTLPKQTLEMESDVMSE